MSGLPRSAGRTAFGGDPASYHAVRPGYPDWVFETLRERCGLRPGAAGFEAIGYEERAWILPLDQAAVRALYGTFSDVAQHEPAERERLLDALADIAEHEFGGQVERNMITALYTARRPVVPYAPPGA